MWVKRLLIMLGLTMVTLLAAAACTPDTPGAANAVTPSSATETASNQVQSSGGGGVVDTTPLPDTELADQPPGQSAPGAGAGSGSPAEPTAPGGPLPPGTTVVYTNDTYKWAVDYPADFVFRPLPAEKLAPLTPLPAAAFTFINPVTAASDVADLEPADLEIRVYAAGQAASLESWLTSSGLRPADDAAPLPPFQTAHVAGVQLCAATMLAPGCAYFVMGRDWVYQLTPVTLEGEAMVNTFRLIP